MNIDSGIDYRLRVLQQAELLVSPLTQRKHPLKRNHFTALSNNQHTLSQDYIHINGRDIAIKVVPKNTLYGDFRALCMQPRSASDFIEIANEFSTVLVDDVPILNDIIADPDKALYLPRRWVYDRRASSFLRAEQPILQLYDGQNWRLKLSSARSLYRNAIEEYLKAGTRLDEIKRRYDYLNNPKP